MSGPGGAPRPLRPIVERYGEIAVVEAAFAALGYPASWITHPGECRRVALSCEHERRTRAIHSA